MSDHLTLEGFHNIDPGEVMVEWEREDLSRAIYAASVARVSPALGSDGVSTDKAFLQALASMARFAAAVYFEADHANETEAKS
jgi:hypothetical protein